MTKPSDDLEAVRAVVAALEGLTPDVQERVIRWAREKLGLPGAQLSGVAPGQRSQPAATSTQTSEGLITTGATDIKAFMAAKNPRTDNQFAAAVAYYYRFEAPPSARKESITKDDLQEACRLTGRGRFKRPIVTLFNAQKNGLLDKVGRGAFALNTVGENLVALTLPREKAQTPTPRKAKKRPRISKSRR